MAALAVVSQNIMMSAAYATFSVLLIAVEGRYGATRVGTSFALALMILGTPKPRDHNPLPSWQRVAWRPAKI
jgi:hypothetical protein